MGGHEPNYNEGARGYETDVLLVNKFKDFKRNCRKGQLMSSDLISGSMHHKY